MMRIVLLVAVLVILLILSALIVTGYNKQKKNRVIVGIFLTVMLTMAGAVGTISAPVVATGEVVFVGEKQITIIDDSGHARYVNLEEIAHYGEFAKQDKVQLVENFLTREVIYLTKLNTD